MSNTSNELAKADQQVALAERHVSAQLEVLGLMRAAGISTEGARALLAQFEATLRQHRAERDRIELQLACAWEHAEAA
jgi:hypothetical protein